MRIFALILCTVSPSPDIQTLVTRPWGLRCSDCTALGSDEVTVASILPPLVSPIWRHDFLSASTLLACTGSLWIGVPSSVPSGKVQRWKAPGLECKTSSGSGPARLEEKGTLNDRLTVESTPDGGVTGGAPWGRRRGGCCEFDISVCGLDMPKAGVILSQPCRAWPVKFDILCMVPSSVSPVCPRRDGTGWMSEYERGGVQEELGSEKVRVTLGGGGYNR